MKKLFIILIIGFVFSSMIALFIFLKSSKTITSSNIQSTAENLTIDPQKPETQVIVKSAYLTKNGFVVIRDVDGDKLGQVIEMSKPLKPGKHENLVISLGRANVEGLSLIAMIYDDYENDEIFNDFDQPAIDSNNKLIAKYINTGESLPNSMVESSAMGMMNHNMPGMKAMAKVRYTDDGFVPERIEVPEGSMVQFINESSMDMWVASSPHPAHTKLSTFDQFKPSKKRAVYEYVFSEKGEWDYHDHINPSSGGWVYVR
jgi:plastocyanin